MNSNLQLLAAVTFFSTLLLVALLPVWDDAGVQAEEVVGPTPTPPALPGSDFDIPGLPSDGKISSLKHPKLDSVLNGIIEAMSTGGLTVQAAAEGALANGDQSVAVAIYTTEGYVDALETYLQANGASPRNTGADYIEAYVPVFLLPEVSEQVGVIEISAIIPPQPAQGTVVSEGVAVHGVRSWHAAGYKGSGVKVGIIDASFRSFAGLQGSELPSSVRARCYTDVGTFTSNVSDCTYVGIPERSRQHGTAVAEAVFDIAPEATYYIANPRSWATFSARPTGWSLRAST